MDREWAIGGGFRNILDMRFTYMRPLYYDAPDKFIQTGGMDAISAAISNKLAEGIGVGITANYYMRYFENNEFIAKGALVFMPGNSVPDTFDVWQHDNSHFSGLNFDIGVIGEFNIVRASAVIHTPYKLKQNTIFSSLTMVPPEPPPTLSSDRTNHFHNQVSVKLFLWNLGQAYRKFAC